MNAFPAADADPAEAARKAAQKMKALIIFIRDFFMAPFVRVEHKEGPRPPFMLASKCKLRSDVQCNRTCVNVRRHSAVNTRSYIASNIVSNGHASPCAIRRKR